MRGNGRPKRQNARNAENASAKDFMQVRITYFLSQIGQKESLRTGGNGARKQRLEGEIDQKDLDIMEINESGALSLDIVHGAKSGYADPLNPQWAKIFFDAPFSDIESAIADYRSILAQRVEVIAGLKTAEEEKKRKKDDELVATRIKQQAAIDEFFADPSQRETSYATCMGIDISDHPQAQDWRTERDRRASADKASEAAENLRRETAKLQQIAAWVKQNGTENQKQRLAASLLPAEEVMKAIEEHAFAPLADFPMYQKITAGAVRRTCSMKCECEYGDPCDVDFKAYEFDEASADNWDAMRRMTALLPSDATVSLRMHEGVCQDRSCKWGNGEGHLEQKGIYVKLVVGGFTFNREFAIPDAEN